MHPGKELIESSRDAAFFAGFHDFADGLAEDQLKYDESRNDPVKGDLKSRVTLFRRSAHGDLCKTRYE